MCAGLTTLSISRRQSGATSRTLEATATTLLPRVAGGEAVGEAGHRRKAGAAAGAGAGAAAGATATAAAGAAAGEAGEAGEAAEAGVETEGETEGATGTLEAAAAVEAGGEAAAGEEVGEVVAVGVVGGAGASKGCWIGVVILERGVRVSSSILYWHCGLVPHVLEGTRHQVVFRPLQHCTRYNHWQPTL